MKVGDHVHVYNAEVRSFQGAQEWGPYTAKITAVDQVWGTIPGYLELEDCRGKKRFAHPLQCRLIEDSKPPLSGAQ